MARKRAAPPGPVARRRASLSPGTILAAALRLAAGSPEPVTLSRLGAALGADPTALYRHYRSRDDLLRAMADAVHGQIATEVAALPGEVPWREALEHHAWTVRRRFLAYPALAREYAHRATGGADQARGVASVTGRLRRAGLGEAEALAAARVFAGLVAGAISASAAALSPPPDQQDAELARAGGSCRPAGAGETPAGAETFAEAVAMLLDGIGARLARQAPAPRRPG